jgi:hypothetical protein
MAELREVVLQFPGFKWRSDAPKQGQWNTEPKGRWHEHGPRDPQLTKVQAQAQASRGEAGELSDGGIEQRVGLGVDGGSNTLIAHGGLCTERTGMGVDLLHKL